MSSISGGQQTRYERPRSLLVPMLVLSALAVLVLNAESGVSLASALFAARSAVESAFWVYRNDPIHRRGVVCSLFHVTVGIWHGAPSALITLILLILIQKQLGMPVDADDAKPTLIGLFSAIGISAILGFVAAVAAWWTKSRVWVNPRFYDALARELQTGQNIHSNHGRFVLATSLSIPVLALLAAVLINEIPMGDGVAWLAPVFLVAVPIILVLIPLFYFSRRIFANSPCEYLAAQNSVQAHNV